MNGQPLQRFCCFCTAAALLAASGIQPGHVYAAGNAALTISQVTVDEAALAQDSVVGVDVLLNHNEEGFLAASFGIAYNTDLTFDHAVFGDEAGASFEYAHNPDAGALWITGASSSADASATTEQVVLATLYFLVPEDAAPGEIYDIQFLWHGLDGKSGFWCIEDHSNVIGNMQSVSQSGSISILDPEAPALDVTAFQTHIGGTQQLHVLNYDAQPAWVSDNTSIATVSSDGTVTGVGVGTCRIYAFLNGSFLTCAVTVTEDAHYDISETSVVYITEPDQAVYLEVPDTGALLTPSWFCDNTAVVTVNNGRLNGIQNGSATVYAICGSQVYTTQVVVAFEQEYLVGDVNLDGIVDIRDVILLSKALQGSDSLSGDSAITADAFHDNSIDTTDAITIMKYLVQIEAALPVETA